MSTQTLSDPWIGPSLRSTRNLPFRLFCFPYAGGGASIYRFWVKEEGLPFDILPVHLTGRERRFGEPAHRSLSKLTEELAPVIENYLDKPFAFFGHSMGAWIAFELTRKLRDRNAPLPHHLFLSARRAPHIPERFESLAQMPEDRFIQTLKEFGGMQAEILENRQILDLVMPTLRADMELLESHVFADQPPLPCPITCFGGNQDPRVTQSEIEAWKDHTTSAFQLRMFDAGHFFVDSHQSDLLQVIRQAIQTSRCLMTEKSKYE